MEKAVRNELKHFDVDLSKFPHVVKFVSQLIKVRCSSHLHSPRVSPGIAHMPVPVLSRGYACFRIHRAMQVLRVGQMRGH